jgi:ribosomal protein L16 Arg81 hydroxylase
MTARTGGVVFDNLEKLLEPCLPKNFLEECWGKTYVHVRGWPGKFSHLLPWDKLNEILKHHRLDHPRLRLIESGKSLPVTSYLKHVTPARRKAPIPRLLPVSFTNQLRKGATLVLDAVDEFYQPLEELAEALELIFHERVQINAYAGWRTSHGFDLHWDDHDVFILQVAGRKSWSVYAMTRAFPIAQDSEAAKRPDRQPLWTGMLEEGDLLYIPRGWWHVAKPLDEPTLHLTVGVHKRTGMDLLAWLTERMRAHEIFRQDLPRSPSQDERAEHMELLRQQLMAEWDATLLERYFKEHDAMAEPRAHLSLPWSAAPDLLPASDEARVRLLSPRPLKFEVRDEVVEFSCQRKLWRFREEALPVLRTLAEKRSCSIQELCDHAEGQLNRLTVRQLLGELLAHGLIAVV